MEEEENILKKRQERLGSFLKRQKEWIYYTFLGLIVILSVYIRTRNIPKLKDITTGTWTLGPDLDPFLFLRWAKYIVENGRLMAVDYMRYVPIGRNTATEMKLLSYMIAWFHNILSFFSFSDSVTYSAIIFPVFMAILTTIAFFIFVKKIFDKKDKVTKNIIALIATLFFVLVPSLLPRTIAGIPEKESAAFFFMFMAFYFFLEAFTSDKIKRGLIFGLFAGIFTGIMALVWGGVNFVYMSIALAVLISFILGKVKIKEVYVYGIWILFSMVIPLVFSQKGAYSLIGIFSAVYTAMAVAVMFILLIHFFVTKKINTEKIIKNKIPKQIISIVISLVILLLIATMVFGISFIPNKITEVVSSTIQPLGGTRFQLTVAENKQPYFISEWKESFNPIVWDIPIYFWLFFIGSIFMFSNMIKKLRKKEQIILVFSYLIFLVCLIFSRYAPHPNLLDGEGNISLLMYFGGVLFFVMSSGYYYIKKYREGNFSDFEDFKFSYILYFSIFTLAIIGARGGIRLIMVLAAVSPISVGYLFMSLLQKFSRKKEESMKLVIGIMLLIVTISIVFTVWTYFNYNKAVAENFAPSGYTNQWQKAMEWVRENTNENSVFAHWWDYGYWVQSLGERATIIDGSNSIIYWDYLMGRQVLTGQNEKDALEFLYAHNATHLLIDSTDLGKYTAYSSIGSDENYDRFSWFSTFIIDETKTYETQENTNYIYTGGGIIDGDIIWNVEGKEVFLPEKKAGIGAIILRKDNSKQSFYQPEGIFIYNNKQYNIPLRYMYYNGELYDFKKGLDAGIFIYPKIGITQNNQLNINNVGAMIYLSEKTINSNFARFYLFDQNSENFRLVHTEKNLIVESLEQQGVNVGEFVQYQGFQGPIKIWEIDYPEEINFREEYLETKYPDITLTIAQEGKYN